MVSTRRQRANSKTRSSSKARSKRKTEEEKPASPEKEEVKENVETQNQENDSENENENKRAEQKEDSEVPKVAEENPPEQNRIVRIRPRKGGLGLRMTTSTTDSGKNELSKLIPGYTAERTLETPSLSTFRPSGGITDLIRKAECTDASTRHFVGEAISKQTDAMRRTITGSISAYDATHASFKKGTKQPKDESAGKGWFNMQPTAMSDDLKADLAVIRNRSYLDPKRFYKSSEKYNKVLQVGTVIEGASEFYSSRLTKKQRRSNITEEILADSGTSSWASNKFKEMQRDKTERSKQRRKRGRSKR